LLSAGLEPSTGVFGTLPPSSYIGCPPYPNIAGISISLVFLEYCVPLPSVYTGPPSAIVIYIPLSGLNLLWDPPSLAYTFLSKGLFLILLATPP